MLLILGMLFAFQASAIADAYHGLLPIGATPEADDGAAAISNSLAHEPYGTVLYDHWYSWQWRYHLLDDKVYTSWFPHPDALVEDLRAFGNDGHRRYLALPGTEQAAPVERALKENGFSLKPMATTAGLGGHSGIILYAVEPQ